MDFHQQKQKEVIDRIEEQVKQNSLSFSSVAPVADFKNDSRIGLIMLRWWLVMQCLKDGRFWGVGV